MTTCVGARSRCRAMPSPRANGANWLSTIRVSCPCPSLSTNPLICQTSRTNRTRSYRWIWGSVGKQAKKELFALRHLSVGKVAPDIEGDDQDGQRFQLSDYRGKVVLLDFWHRD